MRAWIVLVDDGIHLTYDYTSRRDVTSHTPGDSVSVPRSSSRFAHAGSTRRPRSPLLLADQVMSDCGQRVVTKLDQVERVDADRGPRKVREHGLAERGGQIDRDDLNPEEPHVAESVA